MRKVFMLMTTALFSFEAWAQTEECVEAPSCTELGYTRTEEECPTGSVKCPWNTGLVYCECAEDYKYACDGDNEKAGDSQCNGLYAACSCADGYVWKDGSCAVDTSCTIGRIYYTDGTCSAPAAYTTSKTVLGIVVYVTDDGQHGQIMAPWPVDENGNRSSSEVDMYWNGVGSNLSTLGLPYYTSSSTASTDYDSCGNTDKIVAAGNASVYPAAWAARKYAPTTETAGKWCLPAAGIMASVFSNREEIQAATAKTGVEYPRCCTWSSSLYNISNVWYSDFSAAGLHNNSKYVHAVESSVRPVLEF